MLFTPLGPFYSKEKQTDACISYTMKIRHVEDFISEHRRQIIYRLCHRLSSEDYPADDGEEEGKGHLQSLLDGRQIATVGHYVFVFRIDSKNIVDGQ